jgi:hypothetical protein
MMKDIHHNIYDCILKNCYRGRGSIEELKNRHKKKVIFKKIKSEDTLALGTQTACSQ